MGSVAAAEQFYQHFDDDRSHEPKNGLFNKQAEEALIGSLLLENELIKECTVKPEQLYFAHLRELLKIILRLGQKDIKADVVSIIEESKSESLENFGGMTYVTSLAASVPSTMNFPIYQTIVKECFQKRKAVEIAYRIKNAAEKKDIQAVLHDGIEQLMLVEDMQTDENEGDIESGLLELYSDCEKDVGDVSGIPSGFQRLDLLTGGFQPSDLIIIGARPSVGKTAFALNLALHAAKEEIALIFSLEMPQKQLLKRAVSHIGAISSVKMRNPLRYFDDADWNKFNHALGVLSTLNFKVFDQSGMDIQYIWSKVRKMRRKYGEEKRMLVVIDYLQLIAGNPKHASNRQAEISEISRSLKYMARDLNVTIIALSQLSRGVESRQDKRPMLSDLRESGQIEQDADLIAFLYREDYYDQQADQNDVIEIILAKHRNGPVGTVKLGFEKKNGRFY